MQARQGNTFERGCLESNRPSSVASAVHLSRVGSLQRRRAPINSISESHNRVVNGQQRVTCRLLANFSLFRTKRSPRSFLLPTKYRPASIKQRTSCAPSPCSISLFFTMCSQRQYPLLYLWLVPPFARLRPPRAGSLYP
jgi:hypothetical protein